MSLGLCESENYIWTLDCIGEGTFAKIYKGVHKKKGDEIAVKTFKQPNQVFREASVLQSLKNDFIIQLHGIELDQCSHSWVMILEYCNGGSLMNFLNEPENTYGLLDSEFLLVFEHLTGGLEYLKRFNVVHRDVKPDNIMRHIYHDGRTVYKLADFGNARELAEGQNFYSLHGTEPYLHPNLFHAYFLPSNYQQGPFGENTDLWSIGVTLYHTATGRLPFLVKDRHVMSTIYAEMKRNEGIIAAYQRCNSEEVIFTESMPEDSRLSLGLQQLVVPVIAGLFLQDKQKQWSFNQYYGEVKKILLKKAINVFFVNKMQVLKIYLNEDENFDDFKRLVSEQTGVDNRNQVFLYKTKLIVKRFDELLAIDSDFVFLFDRSIMNVESFINSRRSVESSSFLNTFMTNSGAEFESTYKLCKELCYDKIITDQQTTAHNIFSVFRRDFNEYCKEEQNDLHKLYDTLLETNFSTNSRVDILEKVQKLTHLEDLAFTESFQTKTDAFTKECSRLFEDLNNAKTDAHFNTAHDSYLKIIVKELSNMKDLLKTLSKPNLREEIVQFEKIKILNCVETIHKILTEKMNPDFERFMTEAKLWYEKEFYTMLLNLSHLKKIMHQYKSDLRKFEEEINSRTNENLNLVATTKPNGINIPVFEEMVRKCKENYLEMKALVDENCKWVKKMDELILSLKVEPLTS